MNKTLVNRTAFAIYIGVLWAAAPSWIFFGFGGALALHVPPEHGRMALRMIGEEAMRAFLRLLPVATVMAWMMLWHIDRSVKRGTEF